MIKEFVEANRELLELTWKQIYEMPAKDWLVLLGVLIGIELLKELFFVTIRYIRVRKARKKYPAIYAIQKAINDGLIELPDDGLF